MKALRIMVLAVAVSGIATWLSAQTPNQHDVPWVYVGPFHRQTGLTWRSLLGVDSGEVLANTLFIALMVVITIATLRTNFRLKQSRRDLEDSNRRLQKALEELENKEEQIVKQERLRALGEMAGGVAHDFNNALQPIVLAAGILNRRLDELSEDPKLRGYVKMIHMAASEASSTVKRLVRFFRPGKDHDKRIFEINKSIEEVVELTRPKWKEDAQMNGVMIDIDLDLAEECTVYGYPDEFREMLINLIFNAVDSIKRTGRISITTTLEGGSLLLRVCDTGVGMSREVSTKCLEPFFTTKANRGTGLGLSIVYGVVRRLKGGIYVESELGEGTKFTIRLPRAPEGQAQEDMGRPHASRRRFSKGPLRFLLAEDNPAVRTLLFDELNQQGYDVVIAVSGNQAWGIYQDEYFDVVITDQAMPGMSGSQLARLVKERNPKKPVLMLTGFGRMADSEEVEKYVDAVISKPVSLSDVIGAVDDLL